MAKRAFFSTRELQDIFGVDRKTIITWRKKGILPEPIKMDRRLFWPVDAVAQALREEGLEIE